MDKNSQPKFAHIPKYLILGCLVLIVFNILAGAFGQKWIFYASLFVALPMIIFGIISFFKEMNANYMNDLSKLRSKKVQTKSKKE